jgi:hypothetical protein
VQFGDRGTAGTLTKKRENGVQRTTNGPAQHAGTETHRGPEMLPVGFTHGCRVLGEFAAYRHLPSSGGDSIIGNKRVNIVAFCKGIWPYYATTVPVF